MPLVDSTNVDFYSAWTIDKIVDYQDSSTNPSLAASVSAGGAATINIPHSYGRRPYILPQYKPSTQSTWFEPGENLQVSTPNLVTMDSWVSGTFIVFFFVNGHGSPVNVSVRYWVLSDGN